MYPINLLYFICLFKILNDAEDEIWVKFRHQHIAAASLKQDMNAFKQENQMAKWEEEKR